ncbi:MAG TPA: HD-GYP domain-containing protein, partial [Bacteroidales bacterium]|nr:HD-GYP domain-containing protein [Bacteroidales bacterium]
IKTNKPDGPVPSTGLGCATAVDFPADLSRLLKEAEDHMYSHKLINADSSRNALVASLQRTLSERSYETEEHARNLEQLARQLGGRLGLNAAQLNTLALIALLHDIGKVAVPEHILEKPGPLRPEEWKIMKRHCKSGYRIVISSPDLIDVAEGILSHHERWDGSGYPRGLAGEEIPLLARIISLVDAYDAMTSDRPYRAAMTHAEALAEIKACSGTQFDPLLAQEFLGMLCPVNEKNPG